MDYYYSPSKNDRSCAESPPVPCCPPFTGCFADGGWGLDATIALELGPKSIRNWGTLIDVLGGGGFCRSGNIVVLFTFMNPIPSPFSEGPITDCCNFVGVETAEDRSSTLPRREKVVLLITEGSGGGMIAWTEGGGGAGHCPFLAAADSNKLIVCE